MKRFFLLSALLSVVPVVGMKDDKELIENALNIKLIAEEIESVFPDLPYTVRYETIGEDASARIDYYYRGPFKVRDLVIDKPVMWDYKSTSHTKSQEGVKGGLLNACREGDFELVKKLIEDRVRLNERDKNEATPLMHACLQGNIEIVKCLIDNGAQLEAKDKRGKTCLHYSCTMDYFHLDVIRHLTRLCEQNFI